MARITQKESSTWLRRSSHSLGVTPNPTAILDVGKCQLGKVEAEENARLHKNQTQYLHFINPRAESRPEVDGSSWPLVLAPHRPRLVWVIDWLVEVNSFMIVGLSIGDIFFQPSITFQPRSSSIDKGGVVHKTHLWRGPRYSTRSYPSPLEAMQRIHELAL